VPPSTTDRDGGDAGRGAGATATATAGDGGDADADAADPDPESTVADGGDAPDGTLPDHRGSARDRGAAPTRDDTPLPDPIADRLGPFEALVSGVRIGQFVSVGAVGATAETIVVAALTTGLLGVSVLPLAAKAVGAELSITLMFLVNDAWTFAEEGAAGRDSLVRRWLRSHLVRLGGLAVGFSVLFALTELTTVSVVLFGADVWPTLANGIGIGCGMVLNYVFESVFTWRVHE
jgi:putative flippase GtrA